MKFKEVILFLAVFVLILPFNNCSEPLPKTEEDIYGGNSIAAPELEIQVSASSPYVVPMSSTLRHPAVLNYAKFDVGGQCNAGELSDVQIEWWVNDPQLGSSQEVNPTSTISYSSQLANQFGYNFNSVCDNGHFMVEIFLPLQVNPSIPGCSTGCFKLGDYYLSVRIFTMQNGTPQTTNKGVDTITLQVTAD